jgi:hypothetical protein
MWHIKSLQQCQKYEQERNGRKNKYISCTNYNNNTEAILCLVYRVNWKSKILLDLRLDYIIDMNDAYMITFWTNTVNS